MSHSTAAPSRAAPADANREVGSKPRGLRRSDRWLRLLLVAAFVVHSANYLYFFVDDEAIPYVFAQNLLNGKGLRYNSFEGRVEGYSDFLHVMAATVILGTVRLFHLDKLTVFAINGLWSLGCGVAIVWFTFGMVRRLPDIRAPGLVAGMSFLVLAGPLAVWSCSSLETATFSLLITLLAGSTLARPPELHVPWAATAWATAALLTRVDGFVFVGTVVGSTLLISDTRQRRELVRRVVLPSLAVFALYQLWRVWYFGDVLPAPVAAKVLYKLRLHGGLLVKAPAENYARAFFGLYGAVPLLVLCGAGLTWSRGRFVSRCALAAAVLTAYLAVVGDWMFGFRFFLPVLPLLAVLVANAATSVAARWRHVAGWVLATGCVVWFAAVATAFFHSYVRIEKKESWLTHPGFDARRHFARYYSLADRGGVLRPGDRTAYNQAGFVPFVLDLDNIDSLGLCSRFFAELPTTDVFMTEVGRYEPPTNKPVHRAGEAYLLYREPAWVIYPDDLVRHANGDRIPAALFGGYYRLAFIDAARRNVVYRRTDQSVEPFKTEPRRFVENLAHVTHIKRVTVNGAPIGERSVGPALPWLREGVDRVTVAPRYIADVVFADEDEAVYELYVDLLAANAPLTLSLTLVDHAGATVHRATVHVERNRTRGFYAVLPAPVHARRVLMEAATQTGETARLTIGDLRVQGQTRSLAEYITRVLRFPAP
jgi:hypothetical protein